MRPFNESNASHRRAAAGAKHHYIPVFYLKAWTSKDAKLCEYSRPFRDVKPKRVSPDGTAYERGLYNIPGLPPERADIIERVFMQKADDWAARAHRAILSGRIGDADIRVKAGWARFIYSLILRTPEYLAVGDERLARHAQDSLDDIQPHYQQLRSDRDPETFDEFKEAYLRNPANSGIKRHLHKFIDSERVIRQMLALAWYTVDLKQSRYRLLTSDRPIAMTNGLVTKNGHLAIPVSPNLLFVMVSDASTYELLRNIPVRELAETVNDKMCRQARRYVYGIDDSQLRFVAKRLGAKAPATPLDTAPYRRILLDSDLLLQAKRKTGD